MALGKYEVPVAEDVTVDAEEVIDQLALSEIVDYLGAGVLLNEIGEQEAIDHFGIKVAE